MVLLSKWKTFEKLTFNLGQMASISIHAQKSVKFLSKRETKNNCAGTAVKYYFEVTVV